MLFRSDKSAPDRTHPRHTESSPRTPSPTPMFSTASLSHGPTAGAGTTPTDCSGPFHTWPWQWLADLQHGEQCCAGEGSTGKQGRRLLLSSLPSALQVGIRTNMEPEQDTHLSAALHLVSMAHRTDKSAPDSTHSRDPGSSPRTLPQPKCSVRLP